MWPGSARRSRALGTSTPTPVCLEVVDDGGEPVPPGTEGRLLLTNLFNHTMPFIRYELGDRGTRGPFTRCACGAQGTTLASIAGRDDDFLVAPDGRRLSPRLVANTVFNVLREKTDLTQVADAIHQFQVVQESERELRLRVVLGSAEGRQKAASAARALEELMSGTSFRVDEEDEIARSPGGKLKKVIALPH